MQVALSGSRHLSPGTITPVVQTLFQAAAKTQLPITWVIGCCPSGLDAAALGLVRAAALPHRYITAASRHPEHLRARTATMVRISQALVAFPASASIISSGTWLAVKIAAESGIPVFVHFPGCSSQHLPKYSNITGWGISTPSFAPGCQFWVPRLSHVQQSLF